MLIFSLSISLQISGNGIKAEESGFLKNGAGPDQEPAQVITMCNEINSKKIEEDEAKVNQKINDRTIQNWHFDYDRCQNMSIYRAALEWKQKSQFFQNEKEFTLSGRRDEISCND